MHLSKIDEVQGFVVLKFLFCRVWMVWISPNLRNPQYSVNKHYTSLQKKVECTRAEALPISQLSP
jgi:hypothetical protein